MISKLLLQGDIIKLGQTEIVQIDLKLLRPKNSCLGKAQKAELG